ncbi:hypothetical protein DFH07DRAFT_791686 [Mycena maculata]|uniref:Uncharacterized protein n=1 Tax=Mycena maculata TaxID=230809 RepID=A0AAD7KCK0_9AGAR|nr:hypothetical protein DFH07DRAFT_791686 [Mycena maculata]
MLSAATKSSLADVLGLVQKTVLSAASELEDEAQSQVARISSEAREARRERDEARTERDEARVERDKALKDLHAADVAASKHENELLQMRATVSALEREVVVWKEQAKNWQDHYTRVEQDRCGLSTELLTLSRSALTESPPKQYSDLAPSSTKRASTSSNRPPTYKSAIPPSPSGSDSPLQSISTQRNPRTPASKSAKPSASGRAELPPYHPADASTFVSGASQSSGPQRPATKASAKQIQTPSQAPRQIFVRRVQAIVHVKEESDDEFIDEEEEASDPVRPVERRRNGLVVHDEDEDASGSEAGQGEYVREEDSADELMMNPRQEIYGGVHVMPTPQPTLRLKRLANVPQQAETTPTKRRRVSETVVRARAPAKRK